MVPSMCGSANMHMYEREKGREEESEWGRETEKWGERERNSFINKRPSAT